MHRAPQIVFRHMDRSPALEHCVLEALAKLERHAKDIVACHVVIDAPHSHELWFGVRVELNVPGDTIVASTHGDDQQHSNAHLAVLHTFRTVMHAMDARADRHRTAESEHRARSLKS